MIGRGRPYRARSGALGLAVVLVLAVDALLELLAGLAERPGELGESCAAEQQEDDGQDDEELRSAEVHGEDPFEATPPGYRRRTPSLPPERLGEQFHVVRRGHRERNGPEAGDQRLDAEVRPPRHLLPDLVDRAHQASVAPLRERHAVEHTRGRGLLQPGEPALEVALVLAAEDIEAEGAPDRRRVPIHRLARARQDPEPVAVCVTRPDPAGVPTVGQLGDESEQPIALATDDDRRTRT